MTDSPATVMVAVLGLNFLFLFTVNVIAPLPTPLFDVRVIQPTSTDADQAHPLPAVTVIVPEETPNPTSCDLGDNTKVQLG